MDRVRLGRALGYGARHAAKALVQAADAATTSAPSAPKAATRQNLPPATSARTQTYAPPVASLKTPAQSVPPKKSALHPLKRYSGTVLLQVVGTFFAVFAVLMAQNAWRLRDGLNHSWSSPEAQRLWLMSGLFCLFAWFAISSFVRARRVERG